MNYNKLSIATFIRAAFEADFDDELTELYIKATFARKRDALNDQKLYPAYREISFTLLSLKKLFENKADIEQSAQELTKLDLINGLLKHDLPDWFDERNAGWLFGLMDSYRDSVDQLAKQAARLQQDVRKEMEVSEVGVVPDYNDEGYFFLSDPAAAKLHIYEYEKKLAKNPAVEFNIKPTEIDVVDYVDGVRKPPSKIKLDLIKQRPKLPNPATFSIEMNHAYPFEPTVFRLALDEVRQAVSTD